MKPIRRWALSATVACLAGCATIDRSAPRAQSAAIGAAEARETALGRAWSAAAPKDPQASAFRLLTDSLEAFAARVVLVDRAERSIDLQYYIFSQDETGLFLVERLVAAADRGVRVRLLIDDMYAHGIEDGLVLFDSHPNIELRLFNPRTQRGGSLARGTEFLLNPRLNHRMHNKLFVVDGTAAIFGGRNIADEYFDLHETFEFRDVDVVAVGPVAADAGVLFDAFWNGPDAIPVAGAAAAPDRDAVDTALGRLAIHRDEMRESAYARAVRDSDLVRELESKSVDWIVARGHVVGDAPEKTTSGDGASWQGSLASSIRDVFFGASEELLVSSPYFVPRRAGTERLRALAAEGVDVRVLTNSFAANDVPLVHAGYAKYRVRLVNGGVALYELRRQGATREPDDDRAFGSANASLHAKTFVVDRERVFIGSMNLDPRSISLNTEVGVLVDSRELSEQVARSITALMAPEWSYRLEIGPLGELIWIGVDERGQPARWRADPGTSGWDRFTSGLLGLLPIEGQI